MVEPRSRVFHLGAGSLPPSPQKLYLNYRNNLLMLYKNLPPGWMPFLVALRRAMNRLSGLVYLARGERGNFDAVVRAHRDFRAMRQQLRVTQIERTSFDKVKNYELRVDKPAHKTTKLRGVWHGSIILRYIFGGRRFGRLL
jgi:hypothetical protein